VILNRPANAELKQSWQAVVGGNENIEAKRSLDHLQEGGPKGGPVIVLHPIESLAEVEIDPGVFMSANSDLISQIVRSGDQRYRIFCGVAAWTNKQIITEMDAGLWFATEGDTNMVFAEQEIIWGNALLRYGRSVLCEILQVKHLPHDPSLN
jgi:putative transcriptional regulator